MKPSGMAAHSDAISDNVLTKILEESIMINIGTSTLVVVVKELEQLVLDKWFIGFWIPPRMSPTCSDGI